MVDIGLFWATIQADFPEAEDMPPLGVSEVELVVLPPLRRVWLRSKDETRLIQLQENRFYYNWRKRDNGQEYPRFERIVSEFQVQWERFKEWCKKTESGEPTAARYELSYIDHINAQYGWSGPDDTPRLIRFLSRPKGDILTTPVILNGEMKFNLADKGSLNVSAKQGIKAATKESLLIVELTALSNPTESSAISDWFNTAREWIVKGFVDIATEEAQTLWGLKR